MELAPAIVAFVVLLYHKSIGDRPLELWPVSAALKQLEAMRDAGRAVRELIRQNTTNNGNPADALKTLRPSGL